MVLRGDTSQNSMQHQVKRLMGHANSLTNKYDSAKKNELLYPVSPYDEIPVIRDLFKQLSPTPIKNSGFQRQRMEKRQSRQDTIKKNYRHGSRQQRDGTDSPVDAYASFSRFSNDAHEVPRMIEMPTTPSYSEDSELSLEECLRRNDEDYREQHSLIPHPPDFNFQTMPLDVHHLYHASLEVDKELNWPSDEDNASSNKTTITTKKKKSNAKKFNRCHQVRLV